MSEEPTGIGPERDRQPAPAGGPTTRWQAEFPFHWDADDLVTRRELLRLSVWTSGALFVGTAALAVLGRVRERKHVEGQRIASAAEVPPGSALYFNYPESDDHAILLHLQDGRFVAFSGKCTHLSCAVYFDPERDRLICPCHDGVFDPRSGEPLAGPPARPLPKIALRQEGGTLFATEETPT